MQPSRTRLTAPVVALLSSAWILPAASSAQTADFDELGSHRREVTNFNVETVRGMAWSPDGNGLWAINTHGSRLVQHIDDDGIPDGLWTTINNPVAMNVWVQNPTEFQVIVLGGGTHAIVAHDPSSGAIVKMANLPSEPGDFVIAPNGHAFISCMGSNEVIELELASFATVRSYPIPSQRPRFMSILMDDGLPLGFRVLVAPLLSGNNTTADNATNPSRVRALPQDDPTTQALEGLPDEDLFEVIPPDTGSGPGSVATLVKGVGGVMLEHVFNPATDQYCLLSIVPENANPAKQTEPLLEFDFAENGLTLLTLPDQGQPPIIAPAHIDLDDLPTGGTKNYAAAHSCSFPFAVAADPVTGYLFVLSSTNDRLVVLTPNGNRIWQRDFAPGSIPRDLLLDRATDSLTIYMWGTNELLVLSMFDLAGPGITASLGLDPTPDTVAAGRAHFYDGENSAEGRSTCATCHPGGHADGIGWAVGDDPVDRKDAMVTQSLLSIEDTFPYHWRGERQLRDFNRKAFPGLLGGSALVGSDFEEFKEFVFSLQAPRNPGESLDRVVDDSLAPMNVSAVQGQIDFINHDSLFSFTCAECHSTETGADGGNVPENPTGVPSNRGMDVAHFRLLYNKEVGEVTVTLPDGDEDLPTSGWGLAHNGVVPDVEAFIQPGGFTISPQQALDMTAYVRQFDQGIAPVAQLGWLLDQANVERSADAILSYPIPQAGRDWLDLVAFGTVEDQGGQAVFARWLYDPVANDFTANDTSITLAGRPPGTAQLDDFITQAVDGKASNTFLGLPPGNGRRFALDPDNDQMDDGAELAYQPPLDPEDPDSDDDGDPDGHEATNGGNPANGMILSADNTPPFVLPGFPQFLNAETRSAVYELRFSEPVTYSITYQRPGDPSLVRSRFHPVVEDSLVLQEMEPSSIEVMLGPINIPRTLSTYTLSLSMMDLGGNPTTVSVAHQPTMDDALEGKLEPSQTGQFLAGAAPFNMTVETLTMQPTRSGSTLTGVMTITVEAMHEALNNGALAPFFPQEDQLVVAQILRNSGSGWTVVPVSQITIPTGAGTKTDEYFVVAPITPASVPLKEVVVSNLTNASGIATMTFSLSGLTVGEKVRYNIVGLYKDSGTTHQGKPVLAEGDAWRMPDTEDDPGGDPTQSRRGVEIVF